MMIGEAENNAVMDGPVTVDNVDWNFETKNCMQAGIRENEVIG